MDVAATERAELAAKSMAKAGQLVKRQKPGKLSTAAFMPTHSSMALLSTTWLTVTRRAAGKV